VIRLQGLERTRIKMEQLYSESRVAKRDIEHIYGALLLSAYSSFEVMLEDLFLRLLTSKKLPKSIESKATFRSLQAARSIVFGERKYLDWIPYDRTLRRAESHFYGGRPFTQLDANERTRIKELCLVRNAIAHNKGYARRQFEREIVSNLVLAPRERTPNGFLRSLHSLAPNVTRYEQLIADLTAIARSLVKR